MFKDNSISMMKRERWQPMTGYCPPPQLDFQTPQDIARSLLDRPGRFRSPLTWREKLKLKLFSTTDILDHFQLQNAFSYLKPTTAVPYPWQVLLRYLEQQGVIQEYYGLPRMVYNDMPKSYIVGLRSQSIPHGGIANCHYGDEQCDFVQGRGVGDDFEKATSIAVGELLERYFLYYPTSTFSTTFDDMQRRSKRAINPKELSSYTEQQTSEFPRLQFSKNTVFSWVTGENLLTGSPLALPAQCIFSFPSFVTEPQLREATANGCAGHFSRKEAILAGLYECVERDSFLIFWLNSIAPPRIDPCSIKNQKLQRLFRDLKKYHFEIHFLNTTTDLKIPSVVCVVIDRSSEGPRVSIGGGCGWNIEKMLYDTAQKTLATFQGAQEIEKLPALDSDYQPFSRKFGRIGRVALWQNQHMYPHIESFLSGPQQAIEDIVNDIDVPLGLQCEYRTVLDIFRRKGKGYEVLIYEIEEALLSRIGYHVVKVIVPALVPMYFNEILPPFGVARLRSVPSALGYTIRHNNRVLPHPFP